MNVADLQALMAQGAQALAEAAALSQELTQLDERRAAIVARLGALGIGQTQNTEGAAGRPVRGRAGSGVPATAVPSTARVAQDRREPAIPPRPTTIEEAREQAEQRLLRDALREAAGGDEYAEKRLNNLRQRLAPEIDRLARELFNGSSTQSVCCECDEPATTKIGENHYCNEHAATAPRFAREGLAA